MRIKDLPEATELAEDDYLVMASEGGGACKIRAKLFEPVVVSIDAVYTQTETVYDDTPLNDLETDLVVTAYFEGGSSRVVDNYTLSGTLEVGSSTVTVSYKGKTDSITVQVSQKSGYLYNWDFTKSLVDTVQGATIAMQQDADITRTSNGIECKSANTGDWIIKFPVDLLTPNIQLEVDFGNSEWIYDMMNWIVEYRSDDYSTPDYTGIYVYTDETNEVIVNCHYHTEPAGNDTAPLYQNYFTNSTLKIVTRAVNNVLVWDVYKNDTLLVTTPTAISELDNYYFWQWNPTEYPCNDPYWCVSRAFADDVIITGLRIKNL